MAANTDKKTLKVSDSVHWIGALDFDIRTFDIVMETKYGTTYNSYFIDAEKRTLVEGVKDKFGDNWLNKLEQFCKPADIEYIVVNHTEPDHVGSIRQLLAINPAVTIVGSGNAIRFLKEIINEDFKSLVVKDGDKLDLGNKTLSFISAPNLHWPDSIFTYLEDENILFTCDSFGAHYCKEEMFDDLLGDYNDAFVYYFDVILKPFSKFMLKAIEKIRPFEINAICPGHGPILRSGWKKQVDLSDKLSKAYLEEANNKELKALIVYVSAYGYTAEMAKEIAIGIEKLDGIKAELIDIENIADGDLALAVEQSSAILAGSPTINQNTLFQVYKLFAFISPLRDKGKLAGSFGSYGWSGEAPNIIKANMEALKLKFFDSLPLKFQASDEEKQKLQDFGKRFAEAMKENNQG